MANKKAKNNKNSKKSKNIIIGAIVGVIALIVVVVLVVVLATRGGKLDDSFFVSDGSKYVATLDGSDTGMMDEDGVAPIKGHVVYFYSGDKVTDMKTYYEFADEASAKKAFDGLKEEDTEEEGGTIELNGKYVIMTADASHYEGMTAADAKEQIEFIEMIKNMNNGDDESEATDDAEVVEDDSGVVDSNSENVEE